MLDHYGLERAWWSQATLNPARDTIRHVTADEDVVIAQSTSGLVTTFDSENGRKLWVTQLGRQDAAAFPAVTNSELTLIAVGLKVYALDKRSGVQLWEHEIPGQPSTGPVMDGDNFYIGTLSGGLFAYNLKVLDKLQREGRDSDYGFEAQRWHFQAGGIVTTPPIVSGRVVTFASTDRSMYAISTVNGKLVYQFQTDEAIAAPLANEGTTLVLASKDFRLYCLNANTGAIAWEYPSGKPVYDQPHIIGQQVFVTQQLGGMYCLALKDGERQWKRDGITKFLAATPKLLFVADQSQGVSVLDRADGSIVGRLPLSAFGVRVSNGRTDRLFLATKSGRFISLRQKNRPFPLYHKFPERRPIIPEFASDADEDAPEEDLSGNAAAE